MMNESGPRYNCDAEPSRIQALASQLRLTRGDTEFVINIVKHNDPPLEWLKDPKVLHIIKQRKGRWVKVSVSSFIIERGDGVLSSLSTVTHDFFIIIFFIIQEEEDFANFLNHEFCLGLSEVANGTTKRAFLSSKLCCTKMRISKKFKGECYVSVWCFCVCLTANVSLHFVQAKILGKKCSSVKHTSSRRWKPIITSKGTLSWKRNSLDLS
jgi:hypothetical protein